MKGQPDMEGMTPAEIDLAGTDGGLHARLAQALTDAARYIRTHPDLPIPADVQVHYTIPAATDKAGEDELHRIAGLLRAKVTGDEIGETHVDFGPVRYSATYISRDHMAAYNAHMAPYHARRRLAEIQEAADEVLAATQPERAA
jgi:hypothetical protein